MIGLEFPKPKSPASSAWYWVRTSEPIAALISVTATAAGSQGADATPLTVSNSQTLTVDTTLPLGAVIPAGFGIACKLSAGTAGHSYAVTYTYTTTGGSTLATPVLLRVC